MLMFLFIINVPSGGFAQHCSWLLVRFKLVVVDLRNIVDLKAEEFVLWGVYRLRERQKKGHFLQFLVCANISPMKIDDCKCIYVYLELCGITMMPNRRVLNPTVILNRCGFVAVQENKPDRQSDPISVLSLSAALSLTSVQTNAL